MVLVAIGGGNSYTVDSVSDTAGNSFALVQSSGSLVNADKQDGLNDDAEIWDAPVSSAASSDTFTVDVTDGTCHSGSSPSCTSFMQIGVLVVEISGAFPADGVGTYSDNNSSHTTHATTANALASTDDELDLAIYVDGGANTSLSAPAGETELGLKNASTVNMEVDTATADAQGDMEFDSSSGVPWDAVVAASYGSR